MRQEKRQVYTSAKKDGVGAGVIRQEDAALPQRMDLLAGFGSERPDGAMARALVHSPGMSFAARHAGRDQTMEQLTVVSDEMEDCGGKSVRRIHLQERGGDLSFDIAATYDYKHQTILLSGKVINEGNTPIEHVGQLLSLHIAIDAAWSGNTTLHTLGGGTTHFCFPPYAFQMDERSIMGSIFTAIALDSGESGKSSDEKMPFFFLTDEADASGLFGAIEWMGQWKMEFARHIHAGHNVLRRFIRQWYPRYQGEDMLSPVTWNHAYTFGPSICDEIFRKQVPVCAELGVEWMQIDWGWYGGCIKHKDASGNAARGIGNWFTVDEERFPNGIEPLAEFVRAHGMKYCTWVDPEHASPVSDMARMYPQWMLYHPDPGVNNMCLVNFALPEVQDFFIELLGGLVRKWGVHKLKWDNNINPRAYWEYHDDPAHKGMLQLGHIRGVWRVWDELRRQNPTLVIENCSAGGRRLDLGAFGHAHIHHGSDFNFHNDIVRNQIHGLNTMVPAYRVIHTCTWEGHDYPDTYIMTRFGGILRFSQDFASWPQEDLARTKRHIQVYKRIRHLLREDYYPLFPQPYTRKAWDGWQFHCPETGEGFIQVFRMQDERAEQWPLLHGLLPDRTYRLVNPYTEEAFEQSGMVLMRKGVRLSLEKDSAALLHYTLA